MKKFLPLLCIPVLLCGCGTSALFDNQPVETGQSKIAPSGVEYELIFNREVINANNAISTVLSAFRVSADINSKPEFEAVDVEICRDAISKLEDCKKVIEDTLPAQGWETKKMSFTEVVSQTIENLKNALNSGDLDFNLLSKQEVRLTGLITSDSGAGQLQGVESWHD